jgi:chemotaxis protein MotB
MLKKISFIALCLPLFFVFACVSKSKYVDLETRSNDMQAQLQQDNKNLQAQNNRLSQTIEALKSDLKQEQTTVQQKDREISELDKTRTEIEASLKDQIAQKDVKIEEIEGKLRVTFVDKILFDSGSVRIKPEGQEALSALADSFRDNKDQTIVVEGHTDDVKIGIALQNRFPTNWELSAQRATVVVRFLQEKGNIEPERLTASGYSFYKPVAPNDTEEGRAQNRRIEILLVPK